MKKKNKRVVPAHHQKRLEIIGMMLKEMRFSEGKLQNAFEDLGVSRRQIQRGEHGCNITLLLLFTILNCYEGCTLSDFFEGME